MSWLKASEIEDFLDQTEYWKNINNEIIPLSQIDSRYAKNILRFLERKAPELIEIAGDQQWWDSAGMDDFDNTPERHLADQYEHEYWIKMQKLYQAIREIANAE